MKKHLIWGNYDLDLKDWQDFFEENDITEEEDQYNAMYDMNNEYWYDERVALKDIGKNIDLKIIAVADLGLWYGRRQGYKFIDNLEDCLYSMDCDYYELYCDQYHLRARGSHHDGNNSYTFYLFNDVQGSEKFLDDLYEGNPISEARWHRYTRSIRPYIKEYYGW